MLTKNQLNFLPSFIKDSVELAAFSVNGLFVPFSDLEPKEIMSTMLIVVENTGATLSYSQPFPVAAPHTFECEINFMDNVVGGSGPCHTKATSTEQALLNMCYRDLRGVFYMAILNSRDRYWTELKLKE